MDMQRNKWLGVGLVGGAVTLSWLSFGPSPKTAGPSLAYAQQAAESAVAQQQSIAGAEQLSLAFRSAAKAVRPAVVRINAMVKAQPRRRMVRPQLPPGFPDIFGDNFFRDLEPQFEEQNESSEPIQAGVGSGVIVTTDGYVLTNNHVVAEADKLEIQLSDGRRYEGKVVGTDAQSDVAVVKIEATGLVPARLGDSSLMDVGDWVIAVGSPFELDQSVTAGIISALNRSVGILGNRGYEDFLQTDAAINPGNSGGPLVNLRGEVIGINTAINSRSGSNAGVGFAIPSVMARQIMENIIKNGRVVRGFIGASLTDSDNVPNIKLPSKYRSGVVVDSLLEGGPGARGGLKKGDIIVSVNGRPLRDSRSLRTQVALTPIGQSLKMIVIRNGQEVEQTVTIEEQTEDKMNMLSGELEIKEWGMTVAELNERLIGRLGLEDDATGVVIVSVKNNSRAALTDFRPGDIIMKVNNKDVTTPEELKAALTAAGKQLTLLHRRGENIRMLRVR